MRRTVLTIWLLCSLPIAAFAAKDGYEGLIAPSLPDVPSAASGSAPGYDGLIAAPSKEGSEDQQPGYAGVVSGKLPMSEKPGAKSDLRTLSTLHGLDRNEDGVPDALHPPKSGGIDLAGFTGSAGFDAMANLVASNIKRASVSIDTARTPEDKRRQARRSYDRLERLAAGLKQKQAVPDRIYLQMGLSPDYVKRQKATLADSVGRLDKAMAALKKYR